MHHPTDRIAHTTAFVTPVVEHWLEREIRIYELFLYLFGLLMGNDNDLDDDLLFELV